MKFYIYLTIIIFSLPFLSSPLFAQPVNNFAEDVVAPTPQAAALGAYIDVPVSHVTGTPQISIPICEVADGPLSLPINLSYHASGIKSTQYASWCGLGWSTTQFMVTRTVLGLPDTRSQGYYNYGPGMVYYEDFTGSYVSGCSPPDPELPNYNTLADIGDNSRDGESDLYSFSLPGGYRGKFVIDKNKDVHLIPRQDILIDIHYNNSIFDRMMITTPDGVQHHYGQTPTGNQAAYDYQTLGNNDPYIINWHLVQSNTYDGIYNINYSYQNESYTYHTPTTCSKDYVYGANTGSGSNTNSTICNNTTTGAEMAGKKLHKITTSTETVTFTADVNREDFAPVATGDALSRIEIETGEYCKYFSFQYDYFTDGTPGTDVMKKKLKLESIQEYSCDDLTSIPAHTFDYHGVVQSNGKIYVPGIQSTSIDHWGYANGANNQTFNIPTTTLTSCTNTNVTQGTADRDVDTAIVKTATLKQINYPTGGYSKFDFEAHSAQYYSNSANPIFKFFHSSCGTITGCCDSLTSSVVQSFTAQELLGNVLFDFEVARTPPNSTSCYNSFVEGNFQIFESGVKIGELGFNLNSTEQLKKFSKAILNQVLVGTTFNSSSSYTFKVNSTNGKASLRVYTTTAGLTEDYIGGLRVKRVSHYDGIDHSKDIITDYEYKDENDNSVSSGILLDRPSYGYSYFGNLGNAVCILHFSSSPVVSLSDFEGAHISYRHVKEIFKDNGYNTYKFKVEYDTDYFESIGGKFMSIPIPFDNSKGFQLEQKTFKQGSTTPIANTLSTFKSEATSIIPGINIRAKQAYCGNTSFAHMYWRAYQNKTSRRVRLESQSSTLDGVTTEALITYDALDRFAVPTIQRMTNSDNTIHHTQYTYPHQFTSGIKKTLKDLNVLTPIKTTLHAGPTPTSANQIDGTETIYGTFNNHPYPQEYKRYERTYNGAGSLQAGAWISQATISNYDSLAGKPSSITLDGWIPYTYTYNAAGLRTSETFGRLTKTYSYHSGSRLLQTITNVDNTSTSYTYDELFRLKRVTDNCRNVTTTFDYNYGSPAGGNYTRTSTVYPSVTNSDLGTIINRNYFDGLGRSIQQIKEDQGAHDDQDVITAIVYDNRGRVSRQYEPIGEDDNSGAFITAVNTPYATTSYEPSPLNRPTATTHSAWNHPTTIVYGNNDSIVNGIAINQLFKKTIIDPDLRESITYTDKRGRTVATVAAGSGGTGALTTNYHYDDKDRVTMIRPPGATASSSGLIFTYEYYRNDLVKFKKVPDADIVEYRYNNRDLMISYQDGFVRNRSNYKWVNTQFDDYGRPQNTFFGNTVTNNQPINPSLSGSLLAANRLSLTSYYAATHLHKDKPANHYWRELKPDGSLGILSRTNYLYDACGRIRQQRSSTLLSIDRNKINDNKHIYTYDALDNIVKDRHQVIAFGDTTLADITQTIDFAGRPLINKHRFKHVTDYGTKDIAQMTYNAKSLVEQMEVGFKSGSGYLESCNYTYLDNQWLSSMDGSLFDYTLYYNSSPQTPGQLQKNGNISEIDWQVLGGDHYAIGYNYDNYNRLTHSYSENITQGESDEYSSDYTYDDRGNLMNFTQNDMVPGNGSLISEAIDIMEYKRVISSNQIDYLIEHATGSYKHRGAKSSNNITFVYDDNGNMTFDPSRGVTIDYNYLNKPRRVDYGDGRVIEWTWDADGNKLHKLVKQGLSNIEDRYYIGAAEYKDGALVQVMHDYGRIAREEGCDQNQHITGLIDDTQIRHGDHIISDAAIVPSGTTQFKAEASIIMNQDFQVDNGKTYEAYIEQCNPGGWQYQYRLSDHLGNTRVVFADQNNNGSITADEIIQEMHYTPYGRPLTGPWNDKERNDYQYKYNDKEVTEDFGLDHAHYGARWQDLDLIDFTTIDRFADKYPHQSPYVHAGRNPIKFIDVNGDSIFVNEVGDIIRNDETDNLVFLQVDGELIPLGELGGEIDAEDIYKNLLSQNMEIADAMWNPFSFRKNVKNKGIWDLKNNKKSIFGLANDGQTAFIFGGKKMESQDIGNHHFGAVAQDFGFPEITSLKQAGKAQMAAGTSKPEWQIYKEQKMVLGRSGSTTTYKVIQPPYGDDPRDQRWIIAGYQYARKN